MVQYLLRRVVWCIFTVLTAMTVVFALVRIAGNPVDALLPADITEQDRQVLIQEWGLDRPVYEQYYTYLRNSVRGDLGVSRKWQGVKVSELLGRRLVATLKLGGFALLITIGLGFILGIVAALKKDTFVDFIARSLAVVAQSMPVFWVGIVLMWVFAVRMAWFPSSGGGGIRYMILPGIALGWYHHAGIMRLTRSSMIDTLSSEYVMLARAKGLPEWLVVCKHALRNAILAPLTFSAITIGTLLTGSVVIETVFAWPGLGLLSIESVVARDYSVVQGIAIVYSSLFVSANLLADILYALLDPRIRY